MTTWFRNLPSWAKACIALTGGVIIGSATYLALVRYDKSRNRGEINTAKISKAINGDKKTIETAARRVLVLGLSAAGKSSILSRFSKVEKEKREVKPTDGFSVICHQTAKGTLNIWEIGGTEKNRSYWDNFIQDTNLLVFVIDSTDSDEQLNVAVNEFNRLLSAPRLKGVPVLLLANKQDVKGAKDQFEIGKLFGCEGGTINGNEVRVLGTRSPPSLPSHPSIGEAERLVLTMSAAKK